MRGSFSNIHCKDLVELLEVKLTKMWVCPMTGCPSDLSTLSLQELVNYISGFSPLVLETAPHKCPANEPSLMKRRPSELGVIPVRLRKRNPREAAGSVLGSRQADPAARPAASGRPLMAAWQVSTPSRNTAPYSDI